MTDYDNLKARLERDGTKYLEGTGIKCKWMLIKLDWLSAHYFDMNGAFISNQLSSYNEPTKRPYFETKSY